MQGSAVGSKHRFMHGLRHSRVREHSAHELGFSGLQVLRHRETLDHFGHLLANHVSAQQFTSAGIEHDLGETGCSSHSNSLAISKERELAHLHVTTGRLGLRFGPPNAGHLRVAVSAGWNTARIKRVGAQSRDVFDAKHPLMTGLVGQPRRSGHVADGIDAWLRGSAKRIRDYVGLLHLDTSILKAQLFHITHDPCGHQHHIGLHLNCLAAGTLRLQRDLPDTFAARSFFQCHLGV